MRESDWLNDGCLFAIILGIYRDLLRMRGSDLVQSWLFIRYNIVAIHCVRLRMRESDWLNHWYLFADKQGPLNYVLGK